MKNVSMTLLGAVVFAALAGSALAQARSALLSVSGRGTPGWTMTCTAERLNRAETTISIRGNTDARETIARNAVRGATCSFKASDRGPFVLTVEAGQFVCPFPAGEGGMCQRTVAAGEAGEFTLSLRTTD